MYGRADVVGKTGQGQCPRARAATDPFLCLKHEYGSPGASKDDGGSQTIWPGTDYNAIVLTSASQRVALFSYGRVA